MFKRGQRVLPCAGIVQGLSSIPAYTGGLAKTPPIDPAVGYTDPFAEDQPLYSVTAANAEQYKDVLSAGHMALLKRDARTFRMHVYRTAGARPIQTMSSRR